LRKGMAVIVDGELWPEEWTDRDGKKQSKTRITMRRFWTLEWPDDMQSEGPSKNEPEHDDIPF
jgi:single-stranded DNA-binding protein